MPIDDSPTPGWLTDVLQQAGVLQHGAVTKIEQQTSDAFNSQLAFLHLDYSADARSTDVGSTLPTRMVLKRNVASDWGVEAGVEEVKFYKLVATLSDHPPVMPHCYAAGFDEASGNSYLLLQDLSASHAPPVTRNQQINLVDAMPAPAHLESVIDTLAQFHAYWWQHLQLASERLSVGYWSRNAERFGLYLQRRQRSWDSLIAGEGDWLPADIRSLYEQMLTRLPAHWEHYLEPRFRTQTHLTVIHGDAYFSNFLCPKQGQAGATYWLDWQSPAVDLAGYDLVNLMATFWTPAQRHGAGREQKLLEQYYNTLCAHGVTGYTWEDLLTDYRSGLICWLLMPVQDRYGGAGKTYWWPKMQCLVAAFRDWQCEALLGHSLIVKDKK
ncbi:phosphotransferase [soil metagenome]